MIQSKLGVVGKMPMSTEDKIRHYQRSIDRSIHDHARLLHCIEVLSKLSVTVQHLQITGIGRTVNALRKIDNGVGDAAKSLVAKWKYMVANTDTSGEEDEACVPDVPESYESPDESYSQQEELSKDILENSEDQYESTSNFKDSKSSEVSDHKRKDKSKSKSESSPSSSTSNRDKKSLDEKKRKYDSNSSDGETERKKQRISRSEEDEDEDVEEDNFVIHETLESSEEEKAEEEKVSKKSRDKESSLNVTSNSDKTKSKDKHRSSNSKTKSRESGDKSKRDDKSSNSKSDEHGKEEKHKSSEHRSKDSSKSKTSHSSSSSKDHSKDKDRHKDKDNYSKEKGKEKESSSKSRKDDKEKNSSKDIKDDRGKSREVKEIKDHKKHRENKEHKEQKEQKENKEDKDQKELKKDKKKTKKSSNEGEEGIDCNSGTSFADALGMCTMPLPLKKKKENTSISLPKDSNLEKSEKLDKSITNLSTPSTSKSSPVVTKNEPSDSPESLHLLSPNLKLEPLSRAINEEVDLASTLPEPSPNYKPLPYMNSAQRRQNEDQMLSQVIYAKNQRTKVYSGNKTGYTTVPTLYEMCIRILIENIDALEVTGGVPYYIIKPVLERASPEQLFMLEHHNPYLMEDSDSLWQFHCNKDFRTKQRQEMESWREMYMRCLDEREAKLKALTANIKQSIDKSTPVRSTKLAYVDNIVKPPRSVLRKQAKYGTANATSKASDAKQKLIAAASGAGTSSASSSTERISVPPPPISRMRTNPAHALKKTKAPLMAKALQAIKGRYRR